MCATMDLAAILWATQCTRWEPYIMNSILLNDAVVFMVVLMSHDTDTNTNVIIPLFMTQTKVGFPGLMSCVDFDMAQSSRYVGLCGILPIS